MELIRQPVDRDQVREAAFAEYRGLTAAGFTGISITATHQVGDGVHAAIIRAARP
jgi:arsenite methyltransferase